MSNLSVTSIEWLRGRVAGRVVRPGEDEYDRARALWNAAIDPCPALIVRCSGVDDVVQVVRFARDQGLPLAVRGGGHNIAGNGSCDGGVVVDLSRMTAVTVDAPRRRAHVEGGATLAQLDAVTQAHGLATPVGINSTTGIGGLTLGGGFGWLSRKYGMTIDNLESVEVVTAAGEVIRASAIEHPELFWALRGGGGNFGVVTRFEFRLHPVGPNVLSGLIAYPLEAAPAVLRRYREIAAKAPEDLSVWAVLRLAPPLPFLPASFHGSPMLALAFLHAGSPEEGAPLVEPLRALGPVAGEHVGVQPYTAWQQAFDPLLTAGARNYWKSHNFTELPDGLLDTVVGFAQRLPAPPCEIFLAALGGATCRPAPESAAYPHRDTRFVMNVHGRWDSPADDERCTAWARAFHAATAPFATGGVYVNFLTLDEGDRVRAAYGANYARLGRVKAAYDPQNTFRRNQNIPPTGA